MDPKKVVCLYTITNWYKTPALAEFGEDPYSRITPEFVIEFAPYLTIIFVGVALDAAFHIRI